jgi:hypothetical protein
VTQVGMRSQGAQLPSRAEADSGDKLEILQLTITGTGCSQVRSKVLGNRGARDSGVEGEGRSTYWDWFGEQLDSSWDMQQQLSGSSVYHLGHCCGRDLSNVQGGKGMSERREADSAVQRANAGEDETAIGRQGHNSETSDKDLDGNLGRRNGSRVERGGNLCNGASDLVAVAVSESEVESVLGAATTKSPTLKLQQATQKSTAMGEGADLAELVLENSGGFSFRRKSSPLPR